MQMVDKPNTTPIGKGKDRETFLVDCFAWCICHCSPWFRQDHGFDPPCGSHQLLVFLKYSIRLKLPAQHVHIHVGECKTFCCFERVHEMSGFYWL